jgi:glucarate dehydratase
VKIRRITATPINVPLEAPYVWVFGELPGFPVTIVEVETEDGLVGLGEAPSPAAAAVIRDRMAPALIGHDAFDIAGAEFRCLPFWTGVQSINDPVRIMAFGAVEMALWDLRGKAWNQPLYQLLGGAVRKEIPFTDYFSFRGDGPSVRGETTPEAVADYCVGLHETYGTTFFEGKVSTHDPHVSLRMLELIRARLGDEVMLRIDSNQAYSLATARRLVRPLEELGVRNWEDPVPTLAEMTELRRHCSIPFSTHNTDIAHAMVRVRRSLRQLRRRETVTVVQPSHDVWHSAHLVPQVVQRSLHHHWRSVKFTAISPIIPLDPGIDHRVGV